MASPVDGLFPPTVHHLVPRASDSNVGSNTSAPPPSASSLLSTLIPIFLIAAIMFGIFLILRRTQDRQYAPRTYLGTIRQEDRTPKLSKGLFTWIKEMQVIPDTFVLQHNSLDGYFLLRFLKIVTIICFVGCLITWPVLFPVNATGGGTETQLNIVNFSNVVNKNKYYAHTFVSWIFMSFVFFMVTRESIYYINVRQAYLLSPMYASRMSSRTVLFCSVPGDYLNEGKLRRMFGAQLKNLWIASDVKELEDKVSKRDKTAFKLEGAEIKLITLANKNRLKGEKKGGHVEDGPAGANRDIDGDSGSVAAKWIRPKDRPTHRLTMLIGKKVDTINWSRSELQRLVPEVEADQAVHRSGEAKLLPAVFAEFYTQTDAQAAYQMVAHQKALHMNPRVVGMTPSDVVWSNLRITWWERVVRNFLTIGAVALTIVFWSIPVAFVGSISNLPALIHYLPFLKFINKLPTVLLGLITGLLPSVLMAVLFAVLPIYLRLMARLGGKPTYSTIELRTQNFYFWFQVIQVFLVTTLASGASAAVSQIIQNPSSATTLLAARLPLASNFYISYFILQGLTFSSAAVLQIAGLIVFKILGKLLDKTPRKMYKRWSTLSSLGWGTVFPILSNMTVISISYSTIAPLVLGFATIGLFLFYLAYRYNLLFVNVGSIDTKGLVYPRALQHVLVGIYLNMFCMIGLFAIRTAIGPLILMIVYTIVAILYHISLNGAINPLLVYLPRSLESEEQSLLETVESQYSAPTAGGSVNQSGNPGVHSEKNGYSNGEGMSKGVTMAPPPHKKPNVITKFFRPDIYCDYPTMRRLVPQDHQEIVYDPETERDAYYNPAISSPPPLLWIPRDHMGVSRQEVMHTSKVIPITDEGASFNDKGKMDWDMEADGGRPPIYQPNVPY